jgi:hypothetical protein
MNGGVAKPDKVVKKGKQKYNTYKISDRRRAMGSRVHNYFQNSPQVSVETIEKIKTNKDHSSDGKAVMRYNQKTGKTWHDSTLTEWDPSHFRLFVGNISNDVTEEILIQNFIKYKSLSKVKIPMDKNQTENKGFAFLSFADPNDYLQCYKEMNGKYVGAKPITLERAKTEIGDVVSIKNNNKNNKKFKK